MMVRRASLDLRVQATPAPAEASTGEWRLQSELVGHTLTDNLAYWKVMSKLAG
jgi:hypothetical protein